MLKGAIKHYLKLSLKTTLSFSVYVFFLLYTPGIYSEFKNYVSENYLDKRMMIVGPATFNVTVVDNFSERTKGLSNTKSLGQDEGMFFIFEQEGTHGFWMKDMNYSIDILWFDKTGKVVHIEKNLSPDSYPQVFKPKTKAIYVLEINAGLVEKLGIKIGDTIDLY